MWLPHPDEHLICVARKRSKDALCWAEDLACRVVLDRLAGLKDEYAQVEARLGDPDVISDQTRLIELSKRYTTVTMGPCQGHVCADQLRAVAARKNPELHRVANATTLRPPVRLFRF